MHTNVKTRDRVNVAPLMAKSRTRSLELQKLLLPCGLVASLFYVAVNIVVPIFAESYSVTSQTVSELSAIGAPTRLLWVVLMVPYCWFVIAFGWGVWLSAGTSRALRVVGVLFMTNAAIGLFWPPMHLRGVDPTLTDTLHIAFTFLTVSIFGLQMIFAAAALKGPFLIYSLLSLAVMLTFGVLTGLDAPAIHANLPTPMIGVWERISIGAYVLWTSVLAVTLLRTPRGWS